MTIYQHRDTITSSGGATSTTSLRVRGGLCRQVFISANTSTTIFKATITDENSFAIYNHGFAEGEINDMDLALPLVGECLISITNASPNDTFKVLLSIEE